MMPLKCLSGFLMILTLCDAGVQAKSVDVFLLTGQSNSLGTTADKKERDVSPGNHPADKHVRLFWSNRSTRSGDGTATLIGDSGGRFTMMKVQQGEGRNARGFWGPEFGFARTLYDHGKRDFLIIKASRGGGGNSYWLKGAKDDHMYRHVVSTVKDAIKALPPNTKFQIRAMLYVQGESDNPAEAEIADERLKTLLDNLRNDLPNAQTMKLIIGGIAAVGRSRDTVRAKQMALAKANRDVEYVDTLDLRSKLYDRLHFNKAAKLELGKRLAKAYLKRFCIRKDKPENSSIQGRG